MTRFELAQLRKICSARTLSEEII